MCLEEDTEWKTCFWSCRHFIHFQCYREQMRGSCPLCRAPSRPLQGRTDSVLGVFPASRDVRCRKCDGCNYMGGDLWAGRGGWLTKQYCMQCWVSWRLAWRN